MNDDEDDCQRGTVTAMVPTRRVETRRDLEARRIADLSARLQQIDTLVVDQKRLLREQKYTRLELNNLIGAYARFLR